MEFQIALDVVYQGLDSVNALRLPEAAMSLSPDVILTGEGGCLDSLELVTLVLTIERRIRDLTGQEVSLLDGADFEHQLAAFRNPSSLAKLIVEKSTD